MPAPWQASTTYAPGSTVTPTTGAGQTVVTSAPDNPSFDSDISDWTAEGSGWSFTSSAQYDGGGSAAYAAGAGDGHFLVNDNHVPIVPGQRIAATIMVAQGASSANEAGGGVAVFWFDADDNYLTGSADTSRDTGNIVKSSDGAPWKRSSVNAVAPAGAAFAAIGIAAFNHGSDPCFFDQAAWDYAYTAPAAPLVYTAVQTDPGKSGATEPAWPTTPGEMVQDNEVTWICGGVERVTWECSPLMKSGDTEPTFPTVVDAEVLDNTVNWKCITPQITDPNCPQTKIVGIAATKVFAADNDIVRFSATADPTDWTTTNDAGFLPFGLQNFGANPAAAMNLYRSNLVVFNTEGCQMWQVDEDPANMSLLDAVPLGSTQQHAMSPVSNDLFILTPLGVRTMGIAAGSQNLMAGDVGMPIDPLVKDALDSAIAAGITPLATYYPAAGQYWLAFPDYPNEGFFLTSRPYPIDVVEEMQIAGELLQEYLLSPVEALDVTATLVSIDLHGTYDSYAMEAEALSTVAELVSITLHEILRRYTVPAEAMDLSASLVSINLHQSRVFTNMDPEAVDLTASLLSIDLVGA
jgi:hypothetical protein